MQATEQVGELGCESKNYCLFFVAVEYHVVRILNKKAITRRGARRPLSGPLRLQAGVMRLPGDK